jgi:dienelactone hydrolase
LGGIARGDDWVRAVEGLRPRNVSAAETAMLDNLEARARAALAGIPRSLTAAAADDARPALRAKLRRSLGLDRLPWPPQLKPRVVGTLRRRGYRLEKIIYETLPGARVPAHLYLPEARTEKAPAVLFYPGHWWPDSKSRPDFQAVCINLARLGFLVLSFDPFGQGERGVSSREHRRTEALLVGVAQQAFAAYDTRCALEYLLSRPEVDPQRIGMTGASGGGYNTWITVALDDRIAAAVPVVGTSEFAEQIHVCRLLDWYHAAEHCHFVPGLIRYANNHELLAMAAPRPLLIVAADQDQSFPVAGVHQIADYGQALYASYGAPEKVGLAIDHNEGHGYQRTKREAAYGWFLRWLADRGNGDPYPEPPTETIAADGDDLRCFAPGQNEPAGPAMIELVRQLASGLPPEPPRLELDRVLGPLPPAPPARVRITAEPIQRLLIPTEARLELPAFLIRPTAETVGLIVALDDRGKEVLATEPALQEARDSEWAICGIDPRGIGESTTDKMGWVFAVSLLLGENFVARQAWDIGRALDALRNDPAFAGKPIVLYARGPNSTLAATYAIARLGQSRQISCRVLRDGFLTYRDWFDRPLSLPASFRLVAEDRDRLSAFDREIPAHFLPFDGLRSFDLPQLLDSSTAPGLVIDPIEGDWRRRPETAVRGLLPANVRVVGGADGAPAFLKLLRGAAPGREKTGPSH